MSMAGRIRRPVVILALACARGARGSEWVDPDTPADARVRDHRGVRYTLAFSDEFNVDGRTFRDGDDPVWTALSGLVTSNEQYNAYNDTLATTSGGKLRLKTIAADWVSPSDPSVTRTYQTAMLQSWNKLCFTEGLVEISAQMPGRHDVGGLWPAFWMMGNLGRATFPASTDKVWPFVFDECPTRDDRDANQFGTQELHACYGGTPRGAPEIDIIETMPGRFEFDYAARIASGECPAIDAETLALIRTRQPMVSTSVQAAPGQPKGARERPKLGCLPANFTARGGSVGEQYYPELYPTAANYGDDDDRAYGAALDVALNYWFYGDEFAPGGIELHTDALSANTMLNASHFERQHIYQVEWRAGADGFVRFSLDGEKQFHVGAATLTAKRAVTFDDGRQDGTMLPRHVPDEPMYLILNVDLAPRWGWEFCPAECDCCSDCRLSRCTTCMQRDASGFEYNAREWLAKLCAQLPVEYTIDYVRVYQREGEHSIGCDPPRRPTTEFILEQRSRYTPEGSDEPLRAVLPGGANCSAADHHACGGKARGACAPFAPGGADGVCVCAAEFTGPACLARRIGVARECGSLPNGALASISSWSDVRASSVASSVAGGTAAAVERCLSLEVETVADLEKLITLQCARAAGFEVAERACGEVGPNGAYRACSVRQRANHVLLAWAEGVHGDAECCTLLGHTLGCTQRQPLSRPLVLLLLSAIFLVTLAPGTRRALRALPRALARAAGASALCAAPRVDRYDRRGNGHGAAGATAWEVADPSGERGAASAWKSIAPGAALVRANDGHGVRLRSRFQIARPAVGVGAPRAPARGAERAPATAAELARARTMLDADEALSRGVADEAALSPRAPNGARVRPVAAPSLASLRALFSELLQVYGFQPDSVRAQQEHLVQLWENQTAGCGDELLGASQLHDTMFESFERWLDVSAGLFSYERRRQVVFVSYRMPTHEQRLREMALYLCLWAEAAELRFCPEAICFLFECARKHVRPPAADDGRDDDDDDGLEGGSHDARALHGGGARERGLGASSTRPPCFVRDYVAPLSACLARSHAARLEAETPPSAARAKASGRAHSPANLPPDSPPRRAGAPPTAARAPARAASAAPGVAGAERACLSCDDLNEMFWAPDRVRAIVTAEGKPVLNFFAHERWAALARVDWVASLRGAKRHTEVRAWHCVFVAYARVVIFHAAAFYTMMVVAHHLYAERAWLRPTASAPLYAGLLVPGILQFISDLCRLRIKPSATLLGTLLDADRSLPTLLQLGLFVALATRAARTAVLDVLFFAVSALVIFKAVFAPRTFNRRQRGFDSRVHEPRGSWLHVWAFWSAVLCAKAACEGHFVFRTLVLASERLEALRPLGPFVELRLVAEVLSTPRLTSRLFQQLLLWATAWAVHVASTYYWYMLGVALAGGARGFAMGRLARPRNLPSGTARASGGLRELPALGLRQLLPMDESLRSAALGPLGAGAQLHPALERRWATLWNAICFSMLRADLLSAAEVEPLAYAAVNAGAPRRARQSDPPNSPIATAHVHEGRCTTPSNGTDERALPAEAGVPMSRPFLFRERSGNGAPAPLLPRSDEFLRRLGGFSRSLRMDMPRPTTVEAMPSFSVLILHGRQPIITTDAQLVARVARSSVASAEAGLSKDAPAPLIALLMEYFADDLRRFHERLGQEHWAKLWEAVADKLAAQGEASAAALARRQSRSRADVLNVNALRRKVGWSRAMVNAAVAGAREQALLLPLRKWASLRLQTLYRTVHGMMHYEQALHLLLQVQAPHLSAARRDQIVRAKFQCVVSMPNYAHFGAERLESTELLFDEFPALEIAYVERLADDGAPGGARFFSCLVDGRCEHGRGGRRVPRFRVELPGPPSASDDTCDSRNHALPFARGRLLQSVEANHEGYLEEALKVCNALAEFEIDPSGVRERVTAVGFGEHVFSPHGAIGTFTASSELVASTIVLRALHRPLLSCQHHGRGAFVEKLAMMSRGGLDKPAPSSDDGIALSPRSADVLAGMDLVLRGGNLLQREYMQLGKGAETSFGADCDAVADAARGSADATLTRQSYRLGTRLFFGRLLGSFYAGPGAQLSGVLVEHAVWTLVFCQLYFALCETQFPQSTQDEAAGGAPVDGAGARADSHAAIASHILNQYAGMLALLVLAQQLLPLLAQRALDGGPLAVARALAQAALTLTVPLACWRMQQAGHAFREALDPPDERAQRALRARGEAGGAAARAPTSDESDPAASAHAASAQLTAQLAARAAAIAADKSVRKPFHELYELHAASHMRPAAELALLVALVLLARPAELPRAPFWASIGVLLGSWLFLPPILNPQAFGPRRVFELDVLAWARWLISTKPRGWLELRRAQLTRANARSWPQFIAPGRRTLGACALLCMLTTVEGSPARYDLVELLLVALPLFPLGLALLVAFCFGELFPEQWLAFHHPTLACALVGWHGFELWLHWSSGTFVWALQQTASPLRAEQLVVVATAKYLCTHVSCSAMAWLLPSPPPARARAARRACAPLGAAWRALLTDTVLGYCCIADTAIMLLVLVPCLLASLLPGIKTAHILLLLHAIPSRDVRTKAAKLTQSPIRRARPPNRAEAAIESVASALRSARPSMASSTTETQSTRVSTEPRSTRVSLRPAEDGAHAHGAPAPVASPKQAGAGAARVQPEQAYGASEPARLN